ncbi:Major facilitator superfamily domain general substrate transporter [Penicillium concentricum]|uniref:Major facilitator superfamily domain general substrate transporter n=1 Tax=Penicillium concentricum TaxID=293559 RepID=A0A9W9S419_9EURO|nr:Major facilitator superfamily domain general substrate transporter [Penicillium concentricum]KAJ5371616.1 Major facilitator superfamily domain general substrate transporter [Penicillium concentricum]
MASTADTVLAVEKSAANHVEDTLGHGALSEAKQASDDEHTQTLMQALRENRKAVMWSVLISVSIIMEGYDTILMGNFFAYPSFNKKYGEDFGGDIGWQVSAPWQTGLSMASTVGCIFGGILNGYMASKYGYRIVMIVALAALTALIFITFFANSAGVLLAGQVLCGLSWGVFATVGPAYASEVCPTVLRGYLTIYVNLCWAIGQLIASGVLYGLVDRTDQWGYRIPFGLQWIWPVPLIVIAWLAPESPWWLVRKDRLDDAKRSIRRLGGSKTEDQINGQLAMMLHTIKLESEVEAGTTYYDCFKGVDLRRTEICCMAFVGQILSGSTFAYSPTYFFINAGLDVNNSFQLGVGCTAIAFVGTCLSWWLITGFGRRTLYVYGQGILCSILFLIGILDVSSSANGIKWAQAGLCFAWLLTYSLTVGPIAYAIVSETSSMRLRPLTVCVARTAYQIINVVSQVLEPYFMNPTAWNASGKTGFFWGATALIAFLWAFFRLPEAKGRTYAELDVLFVQKVNARKFSKTVVDVYAVQNHESQEGLVREKTEETKQ